MTHLRATSTTRTTRSATKQRNMVKHAQRRTARATIRRDYPVHKRICLHPLALFIFLCSGVFMAGWTYRVLAETIISATVQAPPLTTAAEITDPAPDDTITTAPTTINGTCPSNSYVKLSINGAFKGVDWCQPDGTFSIITTLFSGKNILDVQDYNTTDAAGPDSAPITLSYLPPIPQPSGSSGGSATGSGDTNTGSIGTPQDSTDLSSPAVVGATEASASPLLLSSDFTFYTFKEEQDFDWTMSVEGGKPPYNVYIEWGDGEHSQLYFPEDPTFKIHHTYKDSGNYAVVVRSVDSTGSNKIVQLLALITDKSGSAPFIRDLHGNNGTAAVTASTTETHRHRHGGFEAIEHHTSWLLLAWPSYIIVTLMAASFWLGERREVDLITQKPRANHSKRPKPKHA